MAVTKAEVLDTLRKYRLCADLVYDKKDEPAVKVSVSSTQPTDGSHWIKPTSN